MFFLTKLWDDLLGIFNEAKKLWKELEPNVQTAITQASGLLAIINANLQSSPAVVWQLIELQYPTLTQANIQNALNDAANKLNVGSKIIDPDFLITIQNLQTYLSTFSGASWESEVQQWVGLLATILAPGTELQTIVAVLEWVYQKLIKGSVKLSIAA
jgi:hypothetical protein